MLAKVRASAVCEIRVHMGSSRVWLVLALGIGAVLLSYWTLRYAQGPGYTLSISARLFDSKFLTVTLGHAVLVVFYLGAVFLACDLKSKDAAVGIGETLDAHSVHNHELLLGRIVALFLLTFCMASASIGALLIVQRIAQSIGAPGETTSIFDAFAFLFLDAGPGLLLWIAVVSLLAANIRNRVAVALLGSALVLVHFWFTQATSLHITGFIGGVGPVFPELPSELIPWTENQTSTVLHRAGMITLAVGVLIAALSLPSRRDGVSLTLKWCLGTALIVVGMTTLVGLLRSHTAEQNKIAVWSEHHAKHILEPVVDVERISGSVQVDPGVAIDMELTYDIRLPVGKEVDQVLLSFNPGMGIETLKIGGESVSTYTFIHGLLRIPIETHQMGERRIELELTASGKPEKQFGHLDDDLNLWSNPRGAGLPYIALGTAASVFEPSYVALLPDSRWLPMPGPNYGANDYSKRARDFFDVELEILVPTGWTIGVPGRRGESSAEVWTTFQVKPKVPIPNFALLAADFEVRSLQIDNLEVELLMHRQHANNLDYAASYVHRLPDLINPVTKRAAEYGLDYPFDRFSLVEIPNSLRGYSGAWPFESVLSSPGVMMFREWSLPTAKFERFFNRYPQLGLQMEDQRAFMAMHYFQAYLDSDRFGGSLRNELWRNFISFQTQPTGKGAQALEFVIRQLTHCVLMGYNDLAIWYTSNVFSAPDVDQHNLINRLTNRSIPTVNTGITDTMQFLATKHFQGRSVGWEAMEASLLDINPLDDADFSRRVLAMKGLAISTMLYDALGEESAGRFLGTLRSKFRGRTYTLEDIDALAKELEMPVLEHLDTWILRSGLPGFTVEDVQLHQLTGEVETEPYLIHMVIRNSEPTAGVVSVRPLTVFEQQSYWMLYPMGSAKATLVPPNSSVTLSVSAIQEPKYIAIQPYLSYNRSQWEVPLPSPTVGLPSPENGTRVDSAGYSEEQFREIVVDDLDSSFSVANNTLQPPGFLLVNLLRPGTMSKPDYDQGLPRYEFLTTEPQIWSRSNLSGAHGKYRRTTAVGIGSASGGWARFESSLPESGEWKLHYHLPLEPRQAENYETMYLTYMGEAAAKSQPWGKQGSYQIRILQRSGVQEVTFDAALGHLGWNDLGTYSLEEGPTTVEVSNESDGTFVYADAVKWIPR